MTQRTNEEKALACLGFAFTLALLALASASVADSLDHKGLTSGVLFVFTFGGASGVVASVLWAALFYLSDKE